MDRSNDFAGLRNRAVNKGLELREEEKAQEEVQQQEAAAQETPPAPPAKKVNKAVELGSAVAGGVVDLYNSVGSLPKLLDKRFYQPTDPENPWSYDAPWLIKNKPITHTAWGGFIRGGIELAGGVVGAGKVAWGVKGLKGVATAAKATRLGRVGLGAAQGAAYDFVSNQSQESNLARTLIDIKPEWSGLLEPIATQDTMSPAMKSAYNIGEGLGIGAFFDLAFEGMGLGLKSIAKNKKKAAKKITGGDVDKLYKAINDSSDVDYAALTNQVDKGAKATFERSLYRKFKNKSKKTKAKVPTIAEWRAKEKPWDKLDDTQREGFRKIYAEKNNLDWGDERDFTLNSRKQGDANKDLAVEQLEFDLSTNSSRQNPAYYKGGDISDNQALITTSNPVKGVRDMIEIRNNPTQKYGSPEGTITEANIRRAEYTAPGMMLAESNALAKQLQANPAYQKLYEGANAKVIQEDLKIAATDVLKFISDSGNSRLIDIPEKDIQTYINSKIKGDPTVIEGLPVLNKAQLNATDVVLGQLLFEARDLAKASLSVADQISPSSPGGLLDGILSRYSAIAQLRKETSIASSYNLKRFDSGKFNIKETIANASLAARSEVATFKQLLKGDVDNDLLESFIHFTATGNGNKQTFKDLDAFFRNKLHGYKNGNQYQRNAILNELMVMGINSILSGPKTVARALVGTGLGTAMRPVATMIGAVGDMDGMTFRSAAASLGGMMDARTEAWKKAVADFQNYNLDTKGFRGFTETTADQEWRAMMSHFDQNGTQGDKAMALIADNLRNLNKSPFFNYGPRTMKAMDTYFTQIIGRGRQRQLAFNDVYTKLTDQGIMVSDKDMPDLLRRVEQDFESKVFSADGQVTDEMALFAADEAKLTKELTGIAKDIDKIFDKLPFLKPYFLFARTGVNALMMTSKYTPLLNNAIKEHTDIFTKAWDDPEMLQYGIKSQADLNVAKATARGRMAIGYSFAAMAGTMALNGTITGNGPPDRQLKTAWIQQGWQPRSFKIGNSYVSYEALEPFNAFFSLAADITDSQKVMGEEWVGNWYGRLAHLVGANVINKSFMAGLLQIADLATSQLGDAPRAAANIVNNQIPLAGLRNEIGKVFSPGMRELESGFWQSIGNRNLWADLVTKDQFLPYRYDILSGEKLRDWDPMTRLVNAVLPINLNIGATNETRELLMRSGINLAQTFNSGPNGQLLENRPDLKSKYQFYMGQQNIEAQLAEVMTPEIIDSIQRMERGKKDYEAKDTLHGRVIMPIFRTAKQTAWDLLLQDPQLGGEAQQIDTLHSLGKLEDQFRSEGQYGKEAQVRKEVEAIKNLPK